MTISEHLADHALTLWESQLPENIREIAKTFFVDALSCVFLGSTSASVQAVIPFVLEYGGSKSCIFPGQPPVATDAAHCAMLCAMAAHSNDFDDMSINMNGHPSALLVPVIFSLGQKYGSNGSEMLRAYIVGVEIDAIIGRALTAFKYPKGLNPTCFAGIFGAVAAAGCMLKMDRSKLANAFGIAVSEASGCKANFGTMSKDLAIGMTAVKAITAAECARQGVDASPDAFEGPFGLFHALLDLPVDADEIHRIIAEHKSDFTDPGLVMKPYPSCRGNHSGIDCITAIMRVHSFAADDIDRIICRVDQAAFDTDRYEYPKTPSEAKFSMAFCIAKVIERGEIKIDDFIGEEIQDNKPFSLIPRIEIICSPEYFPESRFGTEVEVLLKDGSVYREKVCFAKGDPLNPMCAEEVGVKLRQCLSKLFPPAMAQTAAALLNDVEKLESAVQIIDLLYGERTNYYEEKF